MQFADNSSPDQPEMGLRCPLTESLDTVVNIDEHRILRLDCTDARANLDFRCSHMT